jgi:hexosaminidase
VVDTRYVRAVDETGQTLIPPSLLQFAETFQEDLETTLSIKIPLKTQTVKESSHDSIFLTLSSKPTFLDAAGRQSSEGYTIDVTGSGIVIAGASPLGVWWGTRSLLQAAKLHNLEITLGSGTDTPGWASRGVMVSRISWPIHVFCR